MKKSYEREEVERMMPLLRSIGREVCARAAEVRRVRDRIVALFPTNPVHRDEIQRLESELSMQRRELRNAERELTRLGCRLDDKAAARILIPAGRREHVIEGFLGRTRFVPSGRSAATGRAVS